VLRPAWTGSGDPVLPSPHPAGQPAPTDPPLYPAEQKRLLFIAVPAHLHDVGAQRNNTAI